MQTKSFKDFKMHLRKYANVININNNIIFNNNMNVTLM